MRFRTPGAILLAAALVLLPTAAHAGGSDSPTPYTVTADGLTLPVGTTFEKNGHINYKVTKLDGTGEKTFNVHQSVPHNNVWPKAAYVGQSFYPWTAHPDFAAAFPGGYCVTWVQVSLYNEHFGEGGQAPVCTDPAEPTDPVIPTDPTDPVSPTDPSTPLTPTPTDPVVPPTDPADPVDHAVSTEPELISEVLAAGPSDTSTRGTLAATGTPVAALGALGALTVAAGAALVVLARRRPTSGQGR